jgi:hypothetical protein
MKSPLILAAALAAATLVTPAIAGPLPGFVLAAQTDRFAFYTQGQGAKVDAQRSEKFLGEVEQELGHHLTTRAEYYRYADASAVQAGTGQRATGVTYPGQAAIHTAEAFHAHEIVHLVAGTMGDPGVFFQEGLAVALGDKGKWNGRAVDKVLRDRKVKVTSMTTATRSFAALDTEVSYPLAGSFVSYLIKAHGLKQVADFFRSCKRADAAPAAFLATFGQSLDDAGKAWSATL